MKLNRNSQGSQEQSARRPRRPGRYILAGGAATAVLAAGGVAWATWTNTANGSSAAGGGTLSLTINSAGSTFTNKLFPGAAAGTTSGATEGGDLVLNVTNPQSFPVKITSVTQNGPVSVDSAHITAGCTSDTQGTADSTGGFYVATAGNNGVWISTTQPTSSSYTAFPVTGVTVAANASNVSITIPNAVSMSNGSVNACQGATFTMPVSLAISM